MAKVIIEFDLEKDDEKDVFSAINGKNYKLAFWKLSQKLRPIIKYEQSIMIPNTKASDEEIKFAKKFQELISEVLEDYDLTIE